MGIVVEIVGIHNFVEIAGECLSHRGISTQYLRDLIAVENDADDLEQEEEDQVKVDLEEEEEEQVSKMPTSKPTVVTNGPSRMPSLGPRKLSRAVTARNHSV